MFFPIVFGIIACLFLVLKLPLASVSLSDTNVYIVMAQHIMQGKLLYKDMFLTNLPFFPYLSVLYLSFAKNNLSLFYSTAVLEAVATSVIIYLTVQHAKRPRSIAVMVASSYLFSMIVLATSDHQTGIFFASSMAILSYYLYQKKLFVYSGIALGLMFVTKGYMLPILGAFFIYDIYLRRKESWRLILPACVVILIVLLPTLIYAPKEFFSNIFGYTLHRPTGLNKMNVFQFFIVNQWLFMIAMVYAWISAKKNPFLALILSCGVAFLILYQDIYFFYLNLLVPFMCLALADGIEYMSKKIGRLNGLLVATLLVALSMILNYKVYVGSLSQLGKIQNIGGLTAAIEKAKPDYLFGAVELTPALSYLTKVPLLDDIIDTNESLFVRKVYSLQKMKKDIYSHKTVVITLGADRNVVLTNGQNYHVDMKIIPELFKQLDIEKKCTKILSQPVYAEGVTNRINLWKCYK